MTFQTLARELKALFQRGVHEELADEAFNDLALRVFRYQCRSNPAYGGFVERRGLDTERVSRWEDVPFLPTSAFKTATLVSGDPAGVEGIFRTSGTSRGAEERGAHPVLDLSLYRDSLLPNFRAHLLPEGEAEFELLCLLPSAADAPDSSLSFMMEEVARAFWGGEGRNVARADGTLDGERCRKALARAEESGIPLLLAGTAFAFVKWLELAGEEGWAFSLPAGSRVMETGGYKGRTRAMPREDLYRGMERMLGVPRHRIVNEYGMTELLSQFYEPVLAEPSHPGGTDLARRFHRGPPWVRTLVLDPMTLAPLPAGETGLLAHFDLANLGSVAAVLTDDLGREELSGFQLQGRTPGSEPRGCSLAMEDFLSAMEEES